MLLSEQLLYALVVAAVLIAVYYWAMSSSTSAPAAAAAPPPPPPSAPPVDLWSADLAAHDGTVAGQRLWLAADGFVFDVEAGRDFYGPGGPYAAFSGRCVRLSGVAGLRFVCAAVVGCAAARAAATQPVALPAPCRDATMGLATMEVDPAKWGPRRTSAELSAAEADTLASWVARFRTKYRVVGFLNDGANPTTVAQAAAKGLLAA